MWQCYYCRLPLSLEVQQRNRLCPNCNSDLHCCKNCVHYDENLSSSCKEPNSEWIRDRDAQNDCAFFEFRSEISLRQSEANQAPEMTSEAERAKEAFRALFRSS